MLKRPRRQRQSYRRKVRAEELRMRARAGEFSDCAIGLC